MEVIKNQKAGMTGLPGKLETKSEPTKNAPENACGHQKKTLTAKTIDYLFNQFSTLYRHAWTSQHKDEEWEELTKRKWYEILKPMTLVDVKIAIDYLESDDNKEYRKFPPNVLEFKNLPMKIKEKSIPLMDACYRAAIRSEWDFHPIVFHAAKACEIYWLKRASDFEARKRFSGHYVTAKEKFLRGEVLDKAHVQLEAPKRVKTESKNLEDLSPQEMVEVRVKMTMELSEYRRKMCDMRSMREKMMTGLVLKYGCEDKIPGRLMRILKTVEKSVGEQHAECKS